jgi:hypothetical protein
VGIDETYFSVLDSSCCDLAEVLFRALPRIEQAQRESIDKETTKQMLRSTGVDLEFNMLSSQLAAMNYAEYLARSSDRKFPELHGQVHKMLFARYQR